MSFSFFFICSDVIYFFSVLFSFVLFFSCMCVCVRAYFVPLLVVVELMLNVLRCHLTY